MSKVVDATGRIPKVPSFEEVEREAEAEEARQDAMEEEAFDPASAKDRALTVNGAACNIDYIVTQCGGITGREYWAVYSKNRTAFIPWIRHAHAVFTDILAEYERIEAEASL